jgi:hypothetical protein
VSIDFDRRRDRNHDRAEALFRRKEQQRRDGELAMSEYEAERRAMQEKTVRLRALRLARDAGLTPTTATTSKRSARASSE